MPDKKYLQQVYENLNYAYGADGAVQKGALHSGYDDFELKMGNPDYAKQVYENLDYAYGSNGQVQKGALKSNFEDFYGQAMNNNWHPKRSAQSAQREQTPTYQAAQVGSAVDDSQPLNEEAARTKVVDDAAAMGMKQQAEKNLALANMRSKGIAPIPSGQAFEQHKQKAEAYLNNHPEEWMSQKQLKEQSNSADKFSHALDTYLTSNGEKYNGDDAAWDEKKAAVKKQIDAGDLVFEEGKVKEKGDVADMFLQGAKHSLLDMKLALDVAGAKAKHDTDAGANNEIMYHLNEFNKNKQNSKEYSGSGLAEGAGGMVPYLAPALLGGVADAPALGMMDIPAMGLSNMGSTINEVYNDPKYKTDAERLQAIHEKSNDAFMIGATQAGLFHGVGAASEKATVGELLDKYAPTSKVKYKFAQGLYNNLGRLIQEQPKQLAQSAGIFGGTEAVNAVNKADKLPDIDFSKVPQSALSGAELHLMMQIPKTVVGAVKTLSNAVSSGYDKVDPSWYNRYSRQTQDALNSIVTAPEPLYKQMVSQLGNAHESDPNAANALQKIQTFRQYFEALPTDLSPEAKDKALHILQLKTEAVDKVKSAPESGISKMYETRASAYDGLLQKLMENGNVDTKKEPLLIDRFATPNKKEEDADINSNEPAKEDEAQTEVATEKGDAGIAQNTGAERNPSPTGTEADTGGVISKSSEKEVVTTGTANKSGEGKVETDKAVMVGDVMDKVSINDEDVALPEKGFVISDVNLKDGAEKGKGAGQEIYKKALDKHGVLYSFHPTSEDALRVQDKLAEKGIAKIENVTLSDGTEARKITAVDKSATPTQSIQDERVVDEPSQTIIGRDTDLKGDSKPKWMDEYVPKKISEDEVKQDKTEKSISPSAVQLGASAKYMEVAYAPDRNGYVYKKKYFIDSSPVGKGKYFRRLDYSNPEIDAISDAGYDTHVIGSLADLKKQFVKYFNEGLVGENLSHRNEIKHMTKHGAYQEAISEGRMTAKDAKKIIESAGTEVPKDILDLAGKEASQQLPPKANEAVGSEAKPEKQSVGSEKKGALKDINDVEIKVGDTVKTTQPSGGVLSPAESETGIVEKTTDAFGNDALQIRYRKKGKDFDSLILLDGKTNEVVKPASENVKASVPKTEESGTQLTPSEPINPITGTKEEAKQAFHSKVDKAADALINLLSAKGTEGAAKQGLSIADIIHGAAEVIKKAYDVSSDAKEAIEKGIEHIKSLWKKDEHGELDEDAIRSHFEAVYSDKKTAEPPKPPISDEGGEGGDGDGTGIKNARTLYERQLKGFKEVQVEARRSFGDAFDAGKAKVDSGEINPRLLAEQLAKKPRPLSAEESVALLYDRMRLHNEHARLMAEIEKAKESGDEAREGILRSDLAIIEDAAAKNDEAARKTGYEQGLGLAVRRMMIKQDYSLANQLIQYKTAYGEEIPADVRTKLEEHTKQLEEATKKLEDYEKQLAEKDAKIKQLQAESTLRKAARKGKTAKTNEQLKIERDNIFANIKKKWDAASKDNTLTAVPVPYAKQLYAIAPEVAKLIRNYAEHGITELSEIVKDIHDNLRGSISGITKKDVIDLLAGEYNAPKKPQVHDPAKAKLQANVENIKRQIDLEKEKLQLQNRSNAQKAADYLHGWHRFSLLSGIPSFAKIGTAALTRGIVSRAEGVVGQGLSYLMPSIAKGAPREGRLSIAAEAKAFTTWFDKMTLEDIPNIMKRGYSDLDLLYGDKQQHAGKVPQWMEFFGRVHSAIKSLPKRAEFFRSLEMRTEHALKNGEDIYDPEVQAELTAGAYNDALRAIFMQDNLVTDFYKRGIQLLEQSEHPEAKALANALQFMFPIIKVPTNYVAEATSYFIGGIKGLVALRNGIKEMTPDQKDYVMRVFKKQAIGLGFMALGYFNPQNFGGYYTGKRKDGELDATDIKLFGVTLPHWMSHTPLLEALQLGATLRRVRDAKTKSKGKDAGLLAGIPAVIKGVSGQIPFFNQSNQIQDFDGLKKFLFRTGQSVLEPQLLKNVSELEDKDAKGETVKRDPETFLQALETWIPYLRKNVRAKGSSKYGGAGAGSTYKNTNQYKPFGQP